MVNRALPVSGKRGQRSEEIVRLVREGQIMSIKNPPNTDQTKPTILVVDDNPVSLDMYSQFFSLYGFHVITAKTGEEGLIAVENNAIDLIMLDLWGIQMEPYDFIQQVNGQRDEKIPILIVSAGPLESINMLLEEPGVKGGFRIPQKPQVLVEKIKEVLGLKK